MQPVTLVSVCALKPEAAQREGEHFEVHAGSAAGVDVDKIADDKVGAKPLVPTDAFVLVQEINTATEDGTATMKLDRLGVMPRMTLDDIRARLIDQPMREGAMRCRNLAAPVCAPVDGYKHCIRHQVNRLRRPGHHRYCILRIGVEQHGA